jgi:phage-related protein
MSRENKREIGIAIQKLEFRWPLGLPLCRPLRDGLWEVRVTLPDSTIARVIFGIVQGRMLLLHGFVKKTQKTPPSDIDLAHRRFKEVKNYEERD